MSHSQTYSREYKFSVLAAENPACLEIPLPYRGTLQRLIVKQLTGAATDYSGQLFDRKLACANGVDRNTRNGTVTALANNGSGFFRITLGVGHGLLPSNIIYIKGTGNVAVDGLLHTITGFTATTVDVSTAFAGATGSGFWQTKWLEVSSYDNFEFYDPEAHLIHEFAAPGAGVTLKEQGVEVDYQNRDNQDRTARRSHSAIYLELTMASPVDSDWLVSISADLPALNFS